MQLVLQKISIIFCLMISVSTVFLILSACQRWVCGSSSCVWAHYKTGNISAFRFTFTFAFYAHLQQYFFYHFSLSVHIFNILSPNLTFCPHIQRYLVNKFHFVSIYSVISCYQISLFFLSTYSVVSFFFFLTNFTLSTYSAVSCYQTSFSVSIYSNNLLPNLCNNFHILTHKWDMLYNCPLLEWLWLYYSIRHWICIK